MTAKETLFAWLAGLTGLFLVLVPAFLLIKGDDYGIDSKTLWYSSVVGFSLIAFGYFIAQSAHRYALVVMTLFLGGGAQLWLTQPLWFPAFRLKPSSSIDAVMFGLIAVQALVAMTILRRTGALSRIGALFSEFGFVRVMLFLALSAAFSVSIMGYLPRGFLVSYALHIIAGGTMILVNLASVAALLSLPPPFIQWRGFHPILPATLVFVVSAGMAWFSFERLPHVEDELVYLFQAKTLAVGSFSAPAPPEAILDGLDYYLLDVRGGQWFATTPPGWPAFLAIGVIFGAPWLVNPALAGLAVLFAYGISRRLGGQTRADIVILLMATSPWFLAASASLMPHTLAITLILASWWLLLLTGKTLRRQAALALLAGLAMGWVFVTRQLEGVLVGTLTGMWLLSRWKETGGLLRTGVYSIGAILAGGYYFLHNKVLTGNLLLSPLENFLSTQWGKGANAYGFGPDIGPPGGWGALDISPGHTPFEGAINTLHNVSMLQLEMLGWGIGSLALLLGLLLWGRFQRPDAAMATVVVVIVGALFFYWFSGSFYVGPRYWFSAFFPLLFLSASGYLALSSRLSNLSVDRHTTGITLFMLAMFGLFVFTSWRAVEKYYEYGNYSADIRRALEDGTFSNAVVIVKTSVDPGSYLVLNDPWLPDDRPVFLTDQGPEGNARMAAAFPDRIVINISDAADQ